MFKYFNKKTLTVSLSLLTACGGNSIEGVGDDIDSMADEVICVQDFNHVFHEGAEQSEDFQALNTCTTIVGFVGITGGWPGFSLPNLKKVDGTLMIAYTVFDPAEAFKNLEGVNVLALETPLYDGDILLESITLPSLNYISKLKIASAFAIPPNSEAIQVFADNHNLCRLDKDNFIACGALPVPLGF